MEWNQEVEDIYGQGEVHLGSEATFEKPGGSPCGGHPHPAIRQMECLLPAPATTATTLAEPRKTWQQDVRDGKKRADTERGVPVCPYHAVDPAGTRQLDEQPTAGPLPRPHPRKTAHETTIESRRMTQAFWYILMI